MEAVGLAAGIVSLGLDLGTRLHTYVEGVKGAGTLLSALAADVSATASIVRQLADLLSAPSSARLFTPEGTADIESVLRRCRRHRRRAAWRRVGRRRPHACRAHGRGARGADGRAAGAAVVAGEVAVARAEGQGVPGGAEGGQDGFAAELARCRAAEAQDGRRG